MNQVTKRPQVQKILEIIEFLSLEDRAMLINILQNRLRQQRREKLAKEITEVRQEYADGNFKFGSIADFIAELDE
ncbi:MAG: hypothetical protein ACRC62_19175 [Microcoleus sp.]